MLNEEDTLWLLDLARQRYRDFDGTVDAREVMGRRLAKVQSELEQPVKPLELLIICPRCLKQHVDEGRFAKDPHKIHSCQFCGLGFVVSKQPSIGVQFFDGWKNPVVAAILGYTTITPVGTPSISLPPGVPRILFFHKGTKVRFNECARHQGYDMEKTFVVERVDYGGLDGKDAKVLVEGETLWTPVELLDLAFTS